MTFEWDQRKAETNLAKHRIDFADAVGVFEDEYALTVQQHHVEEDRYATIGTDFLGHVLVVIYTYRNDLIRIISARKATNHEKSSYERRRY